jgi:hypothetical protein
MFVIRMIVRFAGAALTDPHARADIAQDVDRAHA